jgi:hypothetical protein
MQDVQNIPNPDVNSTARDEEFGSHSGVEQIREETDVENITPTSERDERAAVEDADRYDDIERGDTGENKRSPKEIV